MSAIEKHLPTLCKAISCYETDHPHWRSEVIVSLIKWSLRSLQHYLEDAADSEITWTSPLVELHYPVQWNWQRHGDGDVAPGGHVFGEITEQNMANKTAAAQTLTRIMANWFNNTALADFTNWAWYEKVKDYYTPVLPVEFSEQLEAIKSTRSRRAAFEELVRPFSIGASRIDSSLSKLKSGQRVPKRILESCSSMDIAGIRFSGDINGRPFDMGLVFEIHPLIADYDRKRAYHPVTVGLAVLNGNARIVGGEFVQDTPASWPRADRQQLWTALLGEIDKLTERLLPQEETQPSVILSVNSTLEIPAEHWRPENRSAVYKKVADALAVLGSVNGLKVEAIPDNRQASLPEVCTVCGWFHDAGFTQVRLAGEDVITLRGVLPHIVACVHRAHERGFPALSTKDQELAEICGGYGNACKAFDDLKQRNAYKQLFDTRRRGFISLRGAAGRNRNKTEARPE